VVENYRFELMVIAEHPESAATAAGA
jgi:hypothetical protein